MRNPTQHGPSHQSLVGQLKRSLLISAILIASIFIVGIPLGVLLSPAQHALDTQKGVLQEDVNGLLIALVNQETGLRGYITTDDSTFLQPFTSGRPQYLFAVQRLTSQAQGSDFTETAQALAQVEQRADAWYSGYALVQLHNMQVGQLVIARSTSSNEFGKALFDQVRAAAAHLQVAIAHDLAGQQARLQFLNALIFSGLLVVAVIAVVVLWRSLSHFFRALTTQLGLLISTTTRLGSGDPSARVPDLDYEELQRVGQACNAMAHALQEASQARDQFFSTMSHELRTPLTAIIGFSQLLVDDTAVAQLSPQQQANLLRILKNGQHLLGLVSDVLDLEKITAGRMEITYEPVDVRELLTSVVEEMQAMAIERHLDLRVEVEEGVDSLESNEVKLRQILLNLVSNALKYTEQGEVLVSARRLIAPSNQPEAVVLAVRDTGVGIPPEAQERIFEAFYQVQGGYTRKVGGTGLGLAITSRLIALLGGTIELTSTPGRGSTFTVTLPIQTTRLPEGQYSPRLHPARTEPQTWTSAVEKSEVDNASSGLVLAVDDNPDVIVLIKDVLKDSPYTVVGVQDPTRVMELVEQMQPSAITLDVLMTDVNGWQILDQLKRNPVTASIPVVMLTVIPEPTTGYVLGADDYLVKPFNKETLLNTLRRVMASPRSPSPVGQRERQSVSKQAR